MLLLMPHKLAALRVTSRESKTKTKIPHISAQSGLTVEDQPLADVRVRGSLHGNLNKIDDRLQTSAEAQLRITVKPTQRSREIEPNFSAPSVLRSFLGRSPPRCLSVS